MNTVERMLLENKAWAAEHLQEDPQYFIRMAKVQTPQALWIGCSDSRVPAEEITGMQPGDLFVHRNVANLVVHTDLNVLSVLEFAVHKLEVKHVIVCGHYGCGGVRAGMGHQSLGIINKWLRNVKDVYRFHERELLNIQDEGRRTDRLVELSVQEQVLNLSKTSIIQHAWKHDGRPHLHGLVYALDSGLLKPIFDLPPGSPVEPIYQYENL